ncbi:MAG TPA: cytochrome c oxidase subunit I, partial [Myxococcota bacterium]|nr:cytochrome c oxidase subunit I [Myxococcota bacterium]
GVGFMLVAVYLAHSLVKGAPAPANPWGGASLEWQCASPPPHDNFAESPVATDPYDFDDVKYDERLGGYVHEAT